MVDAPHTPVMLAEMLEALAPADGDLIVDATYGAGGYTHAILEAADCKVIALDRDPDAAVAGFPVALAYDGRLSLRMVPFSMLSTWAEHFEDPACEAPEWLDGAVFDLGVSSMQLDRPERGFSFQADGPLDMRMSGGTRAGAFAGPTAADLINTADEGVIADILFHYGEERRSRAIAKAIVKARGEAPFTRTRQLADLVTSVLGRKPGDPKHPATRTFQALRIAVNAEFWEIAHGLSGAERLLKPGGRLVVVTFHSLEDRIVKRFLGARAGKGGAGSRHLPEQFQLQPPSFRLVNSRALPPGNDELARNPRARSAKLRAAVRLDAPAHPLDFKALGVPEIEW